MTKRGLTTMLAAAVLLVGAASAPAMYTPNPAGRWAPQRFFLAGDFMWNEKDLDGGGEIDSAVGAFVRPAYSIAPNVMLYGRIGMQDADDLDTGFAGGFGAQGAYIFPQAPEWAVGGAFDFMWWDTEGRGGGDFDYKEFQISPAVSYNVPQAPQFTPYGGMMFDFLEGDVEEDDPVGLLLGTNFDASSRFRLDAQIRLVSETGFFFSAGYLF